MATEGGQAVWAGERAVVSDAGPGAASISDLFTLMTITGTIVPRYQNQPTVMYGRRSAAAIAATVSPTSRPAQIATVATGIETGYG